MRFEQFFERATGFAPFPYQEKIALEGFPRFIDVPTGAGKTASVILSWLWRRRFSSDADVRDLTPKRLVYCLPMRSLVDQTRECVEEWLRNLNVPFNEDPFEENGIDDRKRNPISLAVLMGGEKQRDWDHYPERDAIIIGTQDMLLSRALNRGYGMSRFKWPVHFSLLNNACLWVMDETQLMGVGVETSCQMQSFRERYGTFGNTHTIWMSATLSKGRMETVDHPEPEEGWSEVSLREDDLEFPVLKRRYRADKRLEKAPFQLFKESEGYPRDIAQLVQKEHVQGTLTLVVVNQVSRAQEIYLRLLQEGRDEVNTTLLHSRFRRPDRDSKMSRISSVEDKVVVATQVVEAGLDLSSTTMISELAPWPSMLQRFGRCNRYGEGHGRIHWVDLAPDDEDISLPYDLDELAHSREILVGLSEVSPKSLEEVEWTESDAVRQVIRGKDLLELFDTTPDLTGEQLDISRYVRDTEDNDVQVYWREIGDHGPEKETEFPTPEELCRVPINEIRKFLRNKNGWAWDPLTSSWQLVRANDTCVPGQTILLSSLEGGYSEQLGWTGNRFDGDSPVEVLHHDNGCPEGDMNSDRQAEIGRWVPLTEHLEDVVNSVSHIVNFDESLDDCYEVLKKAALWHDVGKSHPAFQHMLRDGTESLGEEIWAKSGGKGNGKYQLLDEKGDPTPRPYFRHELASSLAWLQTADEKDDLVAYLVAAHHGKVRMSIRSLPGENKPEGRRRFARGIWEGDRLPPIPGLLPEGCELDLSPARLGRGSWMEMTIGFRDDPNMGVFRLAYLESILRVADWRASRMEEGFR